MTLLHAYGYACIVSTEISIVVVSRYLSVECQLLPLKDLSVSTHYQNRYTERVWTLPFYHTDVTLEVMQAIPVSIFHF